MIPLPYSDSAFTPAVNAIQASGGFRTAITDDLAAFLAELDTAYLSTANTQGQPYTQHCGGPWGFIWVVDGQLAARLMPEGYKAEVQQVILFTVAAWDSNCPKHIPQKVNADDVAALISRLERRVVELEAERDRLRATV